MKAEEAVGEVIDNVSRMCRQRSREGKTEMQEGKTRGQALANVNRGKNELERGAKKTEIDCD